MTVPDEVAEVMQLAYDGAEQGLLQGTGDGSHPMQAALSALEQAGYRVVKFRTAKPTPFDFSDDATTIPDSVG